MEFIKVLTLLLIVIQALLLKNAGAIDCYSCDSIDDPTNCHNVVECPAGQVCMAKGVVNGDNITYTYACAPYEQCRDKTTTTSTTTTTTPMPTTLILTTTMSTANMTTAAGNDTDTNTTTTMTTSGVILNSSTTTAKPIKTPTRHNSTTVPAPLPVVGRRAFMLDDTPAGDHCSECCFTDTCNKHLIDPGTYISQCLNTNDTGSSCYDKPGFDCKFANDFLHVCDDIVHAKAICKKTCGLCDLVDGNWSSWANWTSCDVTCGNGTQLRMRKCDNPAPKNDGSDCLGEANETMECHPRECPIDAMFGDWTAWSGCSVSCGVGLQRRDRKCDSPAPDADGLDCQGDSRDDKICFDKACQDGVWNDWSEWSECSADCGVGMTTRSRACSNTSTFGRECVGEAHEDMLCNNGTCDDGKDSAFFTTGVPKNVDGDNVNNTSIALSWVMTNVGGDYNGTTGHFTCRIPGIYEFFVSIEKQSNVNQALCRLMRNTDSVMLIASRSTFDNSNTYQQASNAAVLLLKQNDDLYLGGCTSASTMTKSTTFSGTLIKAL